MRDFRIDAAAALFAATIAGAAAAETQSEIVVSEARTYFWFTVPDAAAASMLPDGWVSTPVASGPNQGANLAVALIDRHLATDAAGKPLGTNGTNKLAVLLMPAKAEAGSDAGTVVVAGFSADPTGSPGFYQNYHAASVSVTRSAEPAADGTEIAETWVIDAGENGKITGEASFVRGVPNLVSFDQQVFSGANPERRRHYVGNQGIDVVFSGVGGVDRGDFQFTASGGALGDLFEGAELVNVTSMPWYRRETFLP